MIASNRWLIYSVESLNVRVAKHLVITKQPEWD